jgi:hypothetical protein
MHKFINFFTMIIAFWALQTMLAIALMLLAFYRGQRYAAVGIGAALVIFLLAALPFAIPAFGGDSFLGTNFFLPVTIVVYVSVLLLIVIGAIERRWTLFILTLVILGAPIGCTIWQEWWSAGLFAVISYNILFLALYWALSIMSQIEAVLAPTLAALAGRALIVFIASLHPKERTT